MIYQFTRGVVSVNELLIMAFLFVTAPVSAHFIAKVAIHRGRTVQTLPQAGEDTCWATEAMSPKDRTG